MREFIASDLHGSLVHAQRLFEAFERLFFLKPYDYERDEHNGRKREREPKRKFLNDADKCL